MPNPHSARTIRALLEGRGVRPRRRYGQHFLIDANLMRRLVDSAELTRRDTVIEVGTGTGSLTRLLATQAGRVHSFEIDAALAEIAAGELADAANVVLHRADAMAGQTQLSTELSDLLESGRGAVKLVANLPYDVATPLLMCLLLIDRPPERMCFTIQREVGARLLARPGTRDYGPASVICQAFARTERLAALPPTVFWPQPKVESLMLRVWPGRPAVDGARRRRVCEMVRRAFAQRRKTMLHILAAWLGRARAAELLTSTGIEESARPERVAVGRWLALERAMASEQV